MMRTAHLGEAGVHPVVASAARELLNKSGNERSGVLSTAMSFLGLYRDPIVADALGTATEMKAMKNYAGSRLSPWLGHLMVSRSETARPLMTPGEIMQLPPADEIIMVSGIHPIRAKKARYYEDVRLLKRILPPPVPTRPEKSHPDDWSLQPLPPRPEALQTADDKQGGDEDPKGADRRRQPELDRGTVEKKAPLDNEFGPDPTDELEENAPQTSRMKDLVQGIARQASLDPSDDLGL
jgi:type IV secretion system protein VirD4